MGEREPLFGGTMEGLLLWRIASHSLSLCRGVAAGWRAAGLMQPGRSDPVDLPGRSDYSPPARLISTVKSRVRVLTPVSLVKEARDGLITERGEALLSAVHLSGVTPATTTLLRINP